MNWKDEAVNLYESLTQLLDRLDEHGGIDLIREEGPIEDARNAVSEFKAKMELRRFHSMVTREPKP